jgi:glycosyltransferase involved in cell wall biosynthesis
MQNYPLVSIVVPVYNVEKYLPKCLESLINQTYTNTEIIVVNDGSTDGSLAIIQDYAKKDERMRIVNKANGGLPSARNAGVAVAMGEYIWHVDSDDYAELDSVEKMVSVAQKDNSDMVVTGYKIVPNPNAPEVFTYVSPRFNEVITGHDALCRMLCFNIGGDPWAKLYKRTLYTKNHIVQKESYGAPEDALLNYQMFAVAKRVSPLEAVTIHHIYREGSVFSKSEMRDVKKRALSHLDLLSMFDYGFPQKDIEYAAHGYVGIDFLDCYRQRNESLLKAINATSVKSFEQYLSYIADYRQIIGRVKSGKFKCVCLLLYNKWIRKLAAYGMKLLYWTFRK